MDEGRRKFLRAVGATLASGAAFVAFGGISSGALTPARAFAGGKDVDYGEKYGVLIDTTKCVGCRTCEAVCAEANDLHSTEEFRIDDKHRKTTTEAYTVVNEYKTSKGNFFVKNQCRHCDQPACVSACLVNAMHKTEEGAVVWREDKCMGCRYCMIACPFDVPKFEFSSSKPRIRKCNMCYEKSKDGKNPACAENCPAGAITFGKKKDLLEIARGRIVSNPGQYVSHIYGEHEVGGTGVLYLAGVDFAELGFNTSVGTTMYPEYTKSFLYSVPLVEILVPALLLGIRKSVEENQRYKDEKKGGE